MTRPHSLKLQNMVVDELKKGRPLSHIAKEFGISEGYISRLGKQHGLSRYKTKDKKTHNGRDWSKIKPAGAYDD